MLWNRKQALENIRNRDGKRVFYLAKGDLLTSDAKDELARQRIEIFPAEAIRKIGEKPENMTHLNAQQLVEKTHPRIRFRGVVDLLEAEILLAIGQCPGQEKSLAEVLELARRLIRCDVLEEPVGEITLYGLTEDRQRQLSHFPQEHFGIAHFMPDYTDSPELLRLNRCRCAARAAELAAVLAFTDREGLPTRPDILKALNRMSSMLYILMLQEKADPKG